MNGFEKMREITNRLSEFFREMYSVVMALLRLVFLTAAMITSSVHVVLFSRTEVCNIELKGMPWRCDRQRASENLAFIDKMYIENPELFEPVNDQDLPPTDDSDDDDKGCFGD